jgi:hypothetical protein
MKPCQDLPKPKGATKKPLRKGMKQRNDALITKLIVPLIEPHAVTIESVERLTVKVNAMNSVYSDLPKPNNG